MISGQPRPPDQAHAGHNACSPSARSGHQERGRCLRSLAPLDPIEAARGLKATALWQFSDRDYFIAPMSAVELARAAPGEPVIEWYAADHAMRSSKARAARRTFLRRELGLD